MKSTNNFAKKMRINALRAKEQKQIKGGTPGPVVELPPPPKTLPPVI